jgi:hypothetical protein
MIAAHFLAVQVAAQTSVRSVGEPEVWVGQGAVRALPGDFEWARRIQVDFAFDVVDLGLTPASDVEVDRIDDRVMVAKTMATAPMQGRPSPEYVIRRSVYSVELADGDREAVAETDTIAGIEGDIVRLEIVSRFYDSFDELSPKNTSLSGMRIQRTFELEVAGLGAAIEDLGDDLEPEDVGAVLNRFDLDAEAMVESIRVDYPDGRVELGSPAEVALSGIVGRGAGGDCIGDCLASIGAPVSIGLVSCIVAGIIGCGLACFFTAGIACVPCVAALVSGCGAIGGTAGPVGCVISCAFGGAPPPTATPTRRPRTSTPRPTSTPDNRVFSIGVDRTVVRTGASVDVRWTAPNGHSATDWIGLYRVGETDNTKYLTFQYLRAGIDGTLTFRMPGQPGAYEFRILLDNEYGEPVPPARVSLDASDSIAVLDGDCNDDGDVTISELILAVRIALGLSALEVCPSVDRDGSQRVEINELVAAVLAAIG